jgi:hypothetical protein
LREVFHVLLSLQIHNNRGFADDVNGFHMFKKEPEQRMRELYLSGNTNRDLNSRLTSTGITLQAWLF